MKFENILNNIPDYKSFLTVDEMDESSKQLAKDYPDKVSIFEVGKSRKNHPIYCLKIGNGSKNALMFGCPHPNEPMGAMTLEYFSKAIVEDDKLREELDYTYYIIKCIDIDGTKLNEKWFKGPFTLYNYTRNFYRPVGYEQVEWTFPFEYKDYSFNEPIPETKALMNLIDELNPTFMYSLHNAGFGGAYWYLTKDLSEIYDDLVNAVKKQEVPLHLGEPEVPYGIKFAPAIFKMIDSKDSYDYMEKYSDTPPKEGMVAGTSSADYAKSKCDCVTLVTKLPYFYEPRIESDELMDFTRKEAALKSLDIKKETNDLVRSYFEKGEEYISEDNPFAKNIKRSISYGEDNYTTERKFIEGNDEFNDLCKESEALDNLDIPKFYRLIYLGLLVRCFEYELDKYDVYDMEVEKIKNIFDDSLKELEKATVDAENCLKYKVIPIKKLISIQLESGLLVMNNLNNK